MICEIWVSRNVFTAFHTEKVCIFVLLIGKHVEVDWLAFLIRGIEPLSNFISHMQFSLNDSTDDVVRRDL